MFAGVHRIDRNAGVPMIDGRDRYRVDVLSFEQLAVIVEGFDLGAGILALDASLSFLEPFLPDVADSRLDDIILASMRFLRSDVRHALPAHADIGDDDPVVGANHPASGGSAALSIDWCLEEASGSHSGSGGSGLFDKIPARLTAGHWIYILMIHKLIFRFPRNCPSLTNCRRWSIMNPLRSRPLMCSRPVWAKRRQPFGNGRQSGTGCAKTPRA